MSRKSKLNSIFVVATSFLGGVAVGYLLIPGNKDKRREWISDWLDQRGAVIFEKGNQSIDRVKGNIRKEIDNNIPDPYQATEHIPLKDSKILGI